MLERLSPVQVRLLVDAANGRSLHETAERLNYSYIWAKKQRAELMQKLEAQTITEALTIAVNAGLLTELEVQEVTANG